MHPDNRESRYCGSLLCFYKVRFSTFVLRSFVLRPRPREYILG